MTANGYRGFWFLTVVVSQVPPECTTMRTIPTMVNRRVVHMMAMWAWDVWVWVWGGGVLHEGE